MWVCEWLLTTDRPHRRCVDSLGSPEPFDGSCGVALKTLQLAIHLQKLLLKLFPRGSTVVRVFCAMVSKLMPICHKARDLLLKALHVVGAEKEGHLRIILLQERFHLRGHRLCQVPLSTDAIVNRESHIALHSSCILSAVSGEAEHGVPIDEPEPRGRVEPHSTC
eukprot:CAMPEP_0178424170 /NCGR_PEP_ID=MMETSP0689_2-20121128/28072_1 /TAXON_ID=160604 /ORGANISM="Amphidinium massartii, Strain CS-259" /LENGTH=164 /DNA_ID=CAMNT_0020045799 /DNA_START=77 /DNA_END=568 /DNA_ORIENTATION=+